ncbi:MAG: winged helix-turn-helix domain-containing protein [Actinomycetota bacterium]|nr:winged helix-turn-helix domain-containing protein [Actinomycetota bacterium]
MQFRVLGPVEVVAGGRRAAVGGGHQRTILVVLLAAGGETVTTGLLIDAVWSAEPPESARKSLQSHVSRLRAELVEVEPDASQPLVTEADGYRADLDVHDFDARRFESLVQRAGQVADRVPETALRLLDEARALWRGPAFGELADHPQVRPEAVRLEQLRARAAADHVDVRLALGRHKEVIGELEATVVEDPLDERAHGQLVLALYRSGRQAGALATYRQLQESLRDELGVDPSPALRELHERILRQDEGLQLRRGSPDGGIASADSDADETSHPRPQPTVPVPELIGRDEDVAAVASLIREKLLVTLTGPGGVGKTRLAEQVAARVADGFDDGVVECALATVRDADSVGGALITALGIQPTGDRSATETLVAALGERRLLLLLDNCEHVLDVLSPLVDTILGRCPNVAILATSRERLHLPVEHVWPVAPLAVPERGSDHEEISETPAGALFRERAEAVEPAFSLTRDNAPAVAEICRRLDGMPLAIELAAARVRALAPEDLVARIDQRFALLGGGPVGGTGRHRTLEAVVAWSYDLLADPEADLFDRLSVFAGSFTLAAAEQVCAGGDLAEAEVAGLLGELVDKSMVMVERDGDSVRYHLLDTLRDFGAKRLADAGATETYRRAHADYHVALTEDLAPRVRGQDEGTAVAQIDGAIADLRSAHAWMVATGDVDGALRLPAALSDYVLYRLRDETITWTHRALEMTDAPEHPACAAALATAARGATNRGETARAVREAEAALARAEPDSLTAVQALDALGTAALYEGRFDDILAQADRLEEIAQRLGEDYYVAYARLLRVLGHLYRGEDDTAVAHVAELHEAADASGNPTMRAFARYAHGEAHLDTRPAEAAASLERAIELARQVNNPLIQGVSLVSLASLRGRRGEIDAALKLFSEVIAHWRRLGDYTHQLTTLRNLVEVLTQIGADEPAAVLHGAVTEGLAPSFGAEADRLATAWDQLQDRLGPEAAQTAADRGRRLTVTQMSERALSHLDAILADSG